MNVAVQVRGYPIYLVLTFRKTGGGDDGAGPGGAGSDGASPSEEKSSQWAVDCGAGPVSSLAEAVIGQ